MGLTTIYGIKNCDTMKKARAWLDGHGVAYDFHDYKAAGITKEKLKRWSDEVGWDLSLGFQYRPFLTDNVIVSAGFGALIPGQGYRDIYQTSTQPVPGFDRNNNTGNSNDFPYSGLIAITFTY